MELSIMKRSLPSFLSGLLVTALCCFGIPAQAVTDTITTPTTIDVSDTSHDNNDLVISGTTVTINGTHPFHSLALQSAVLTHTAALAVGMKLTIAQNVTVDAASKIEVSGQGYGGGAGLGTGATAGTYGGGGGYGGAGANYGGAAGGLGYGSILQPTDLGSGGGQGAYSTGGSGGGSVRLIVGGTLQLDGSLVSNGNGGGTYGGGGSGGSVYVTAQTLAGSGSIAANGGDWSNYGSGAGRRRTHRPLCQQQQFFRWRTFPRRGAAARLAGRERSTRSSAVRALETSLSLTGAEGPTPISAKLPLSLRLKLWAARWPCSPARSTAR